MTYTPSALICVASPCAFAVGVTSLVLVTVFVTVTVGAAWVTVTVGPGSVTVLVPVPPDAAAPMAPMAMKKPTTARSAVSTLWRTGQGFCPRWP